MPNATVKTALAAAVLVGVAVLSNPSPERHREKIKAAVAERSQLAGLLRLGDLAAFASSYHSVGVASYTVVNDRRLTFGMFGMVFVGDPTQAGR
jgi:hypothetical protein